MRCPGNPGGESRHTTPETRRGAGAAPRAPRGAGTGQGQQLHPQRAGCGCALRLCPPAVPSRQPEQRRGQCPPPALADGSSEHSRFSAQTIWGHPAAFPDPTCPLIPPSSARGIWARSDTKPAQHLLPAPIPRPDPHFSAVLQLPVSFPIHILKSLQIPSAQCRGRTTDSPAEPPTPLTGGTGATSSHSPGHPCSWIMNFSIPPTVLSLSFLCSFVFPTQQKGKQPTLLAASS